MKMSTYIRWFLTIGLAFIILGIPAVSCIEDHEEGEYQDEHSSFAEVKIGDTIPAFVLKLNDGTTINSKDLKGNCSVLVFFHTKCKDCQVELPVIQALYDQQLPKVNIICISRKEESPSIDAYWTKEGLTLPYAAQKDGALYYQFAQSLIPRVYVVNKSLQVTEIYTDKDMASLDDLLSDINKIIL